LCNMTCPLIVQSLGPPLRWHNPAFVTPRPRNVQDHILPLLSVSNPLRQAAQDAHSRLFKPLALKNSSSAFCHDPSSKSGAFARRMPSTADSTKRSVIAQTYTFSRTALRPEMIPRFCRITAVARSQAPRQDLVEDRCSCVHHQHLLRSQ
jgi:hypothetical protein